MIELKNNGLQFSFPEVHQDARLEIDFQRTLRIPDDDRVHHLPPGLGCFPLRHVDDYAASVPERWIEHGGVMLPMFQSEALWIHFLGGRISGYPCAVKIATGKINAVTGELWESGLQKKPQDFLVVPKQPWLDGYCVKKGVIRQFVAMPLGAGYSAEEQITGEAEHGGIQIVVYPMKKERYERMVNHRRRRGRRMDCYSLSPVAMASTRAAPDMGIAPGGKMRQEISKDPYGLKVWDTEHSSRCFVHITNSLVWSSITGSEPPHPPLTAKAYTQAGLPWFDYYDDGNALDGAEELADLESVAERGERLGEKPLPENEPVLPKRIVKLRAKLKENQVREWGDTR